MLRESGDWKPPGRWIARRSGGRSSRSDDDARQLRVSRNNTLRRRGACHRRESEALRHWRSVGMQVDVCVKIRWHLVILVLRLCYAVWDRRRSGGWERRETAALRLGTARAVGDDPSRTGTGGIRICRDGDSGQKRRLGTVDLQRVSIGHLLAFPPP